MDTSLVSSIVASIVGQVQTAVAGKMLQIDLAQGGGSAVNLIDSAQQNIDSLVNLTAGIGTKLNLRV